MSYEADISCAIDGTVFCPDDSCQVANSYLYLEEPPTHCRKCETALRCKHCGMVAPLDEAELCIDCERPVIVYVDAEFGVRRERRSA